MTGPSPAKPRRLAVLAPAKVNLFLHVVGRRSDGYHLLESIFAFADIGDRLEVETAKDFSFTLTGPFAKACQKAGCGGEKNLTVKAARALNEKLGGEGPKARLALQKNLPLAAGLGGGSSDAAAALKALQVLWDAEMDEEDLFSLALSLGADVPACLLGEPCFVSGIGDEITPLTRFEDLPCVLANPGLPVATGEVFKAFAGRELPFSQPLGLRPEFNAGLWELLENTRNDLEHAACGLVPEVGKVLLALKKAKGVRLFRMSGSGATCFGLFESAEAAADSARAIATANPGWWVRACTLRAAPDFLISA